MADNAPGTISTCIYQALSPATREPLIRKAAELAVKNRNVRVSENSVTSLFGRRKPVWRIELSGTYYKFINRHEAYRFLSTLATRPERFRNC